MWKPYRKEKYLRKWEENICKKGKTKCGNRTEKKNICENEKKIFAKI